ncbi:hypothetical protein E0I26_06430 [Flavobacterium rhamnosiphilum]|uniref:Type I restriction modification DNA specificity domain-containing protein n=1 Tax=Flavobacterium rhamnosiphilum TaxID=2541724 RepID=A0A4R5FA37_9FLAO|nr:hypothetical protein [Flavobacterium rhamnosiphilum]TDE45580.1 hypothetical protein E0I26_06430 [Flavobacterium rhamnosiphilum]
MSNFKFINELVLTQNDRWLINSILTDNEELTIFPDNELISLRDVLRERKESIDPQVYSKTSFNYLGLENIQPYTGFLVDFKSKYGSAVKSRCKIFKLGDLLYSKLRPTLNKSYIVDERVNNGICSTEFLVFEIETSLIEPILLRYIISSDFVQEQVEKFIAGAALPRIQTDDFLSIKIPKIDKKYQLILSKYLKEKHQEYLDCFNKLNSYQQDLNEILLTSIKENRISEPKKK